MTTNVHVMIGCPASGKSTIARVLAEKGTLVISSDEIRGELFGNEATQGDPKLVFDLFYERARAAVEAGHDIVLDATNIDRGQRGRDRAKVELGQYGVKFIAHYFELPVEVLLERNAQRDRHVPEDVIRRMVSRMVPPQEGEFDMVLRYTAE